MEQSGVKDLDADQPAVAVEVQDDVAVAFPDRDRRLHAAGFDRIDQVDVAGSCRGIIGYTHRASMAEASRVGNAGAPLALSIVLACPVGPRLLYPAMAKRKLNADQKRAQRAGALSLFVKQYARKAQRGVEPNDRRYDEKVARKLRQLKPAAVDALLRDGDPRDD
jgi:hypothetical protein